MQTHAAQWKGALVALLCASCGDADVRATFRDVADTAGTSAFDAEYESIHDVPDYVVRGHHLYLLTQSYLAGRPREDAVLARFWTCAEVARLRRSDAARALLPDANAIDGGVRWSACWRPRPSANPSGQRRRALP